MIWTYVAAVQGQAQGSTDISLRRMTVYDLSRGEARDFARKHFESGGWTKVLVDDIWQIPDTRREDIRR